MTIVTKKTMISTNVLLAALYSPSYGSAEVHGITIPLALHVNIIRQPRYAYLCILEDTEGARHFRAASVKRRTALRCASRLGRDDVGGEEDPAWRFPRWPPSFAAFESVEAVGIRRRPNPCFQQLTFAASNVHGHELT